jgi:hypothetical protein
MSGTSCANCKNELPDDLPGQTRAPCPNCGSIARTYLDSLTDGIAAHDGHRAKAKRPSLPSAKKLRFDTYSGVEHSHKFGKLVRVHRTIDKDNDRYMEKVIDMQTGEILHECDEPLSQHTNHGTAKPRGEP